MKKHLITMVIIATTITVSGQTPADIAKKWDEIRHLCEKYDDGADSAYRILQEQLTATKKDPVANAIWHSCMGQFLNEYYEGNRYRLGQRTEVAEETPKDFKEWDPRTFERRAREEYLLSLKNAKALQMVDAKEYKELLFKMNNQLQVKTLYEVLAYRVIEYLRSDLVDEAPDWSLSGEAIWHNDQFLKMPLTITDSSSVLQMILSVYQDLTRHHLNQNQEMDLIMMTIERFDFMRNKGLAPDNSLDWYIPFLENWAKECEQMKGYGLIAYKIGCLYLKRYEEHRTSEHEANEEAYRDDLLKADSWLKIALNSSGKSFYEEKVDRTIRELHDRTVTVNPVSNGQWVFPTGEGTLWRINYANCKQLYVKVVKATSASTGMPQNKFFDYVVTQKLVYQEKVELPDNQDLLSHRALYLLPELPAGAYWLVVSDQPWNIWDKETPRECVLLQISDIEILPRSTEHGLEVLAVHRKTGEPLANAKVTMISSKQQTTRTTDQDGFCLFEKRENRYSGCDGFTVSWHGQTMMTTDRFSWWERDRSAVNNHIDAHLFTDRSLYRPGQTVYFKGVFEVVRDNGRQFSSQLPADTLVKVTLRDANFQLVEEIELMTNEFGSVAGEFTLPEGGLTGTYWLEARLGKSGPFRHTFSVEEYKLPAFEVEVETPEETFSIGQEVTVKGSAMALAGYPLDGATVNYRVTRNTSFPWWRSYWWRPTSEPVTVAHGTVQTDDDGTFRITFPTEEDKTLRRYTPLYRYEVTVDVTDINGETHSGSTVVHVSSRNLLLSCLLPDEIAVGKDKSQYRVSLTNTAGKPQSGTIGYEIFRLQTPDRFLYDLGQTEVMISDTNQLYRQFPWLAFHGENKQENWPAVSVRQGTLSINKDTSAYLEFSDFQDMPDGYYKVLLRTEDNNGNIIESEYYTHVYRKESKKCSAYKQLWVALDKSVNIGEELTLTIGSYLPKANVLCEIYSRNEKVCTEWVTLRGNTHTITYPVTDVDLAGLKVHLLCFNQNMMEEKTHSVSVTDSLKDIQFEFLRFRDNTLPGSKEELQVRLTDKSGKPVSAELLCSMYDMALDALGSGNSHYLSFYRPWSGADGSFRTLFCGRSFSDYNFRDISLYYSLKLTQDWLRFNIGPCSYGAMKTVRGNRSDGAQTIVDGIRVRSNANDVDFYEEEALEEVVLNVVEDNISVTYEWSSSPMAAKSAGADEGAPAELQVRTNFAETAFFYPQLRTDANGEVYISFTMPDALTKWKMQGVAHNPDLQFGRFEKFVQTAKDLMIVPNAPRFLREGDTMDFSTKVVNTSDKHLRGNVTLEFFNAVNNQPVQMLVDGGRDGARPVSTSGHTQYDVEPGSSQEVHFRIVVPEDVPAITYRIIARNTNPTEVAGDGEEKTLPVLTNRMMVTEAMPFYISGKGSKLFTFNKLQNSFGPNASATLKHYRLTVECTPNPVWYAIQAMPYMMEYPHECNEQRFSRYYANALATHILKANPVIEEVFNRWQTESPEAFCSALEKNPELKQIVLEETPWVLDAQREGANKQALAAMFDFKRMSKEESATLRKLQQAQNGDGGWPWFSGGKSSDFVTRHIVAGFGHLKALGVPTDVAGSTLRNAVSYMDAQMYQRYLDRKKYHYTYIDETHYLYARSFYNDKISKQHQPAYDTCYKVLLNGWRNESYYTQAMIALTAWRNGDKQVAKEIVEYLKSMAQHNEEMGMFWKKQGGGWFWYEQPVERQAMLIEAFHTITPEDEESLAQMQLWLLKQKQTQHWSTTKSTTEAIYALLLNKTLVAEDKTVAVTVGNVRLPDETTQTEAGTGYFKKAWTGKDITADKAVVRIEKGTDGPAWGGLYWQYFENLDKITRSDDKNLVIEKAIFKVENTDKGEVLKAITANQPLQKGDKIRVRVVITADRDMEFVHLKDMRAAAFEPVNVFSQYKYQDGLWYYEATKDAATHFFIDWMPKGKYVFEYTLFATQSGNFSNGITEIECMYAPEFRSHSQGVRVRIK